MRAPRWGALSFFKAERSLPMNKNFKGEDLIKNSEGVNSVKKWFHSKKVPLKSKL